MGCSEMNNLRSNKLTLLLIINMMRCEHMVAWEFATLGIRDDQSTSVARILMIGKIGKLVLHERRDFGPLEVKTCEIKEVMIESET